jgi:hypothetical protein
LINKYFIKRGKEYKGHLQSWKKEIRAQTEQLSSISATEWAEIK